MLVLIVSKIQDMQVGSVPMVLSVAFPIFMRDRPIHSEKAEFDECSPALWFSKTGTQ
jgi:hypothetical protein